MKSITIVGLAGTVAAIGTLIGSFIVVDSRYAHAQDVRESQMIQANQTRSQINQIRIEDLEDKLFALERKTVKNGEDLAMIERYKRRLEDTKKK